MCVCVCVCREREGERVSEIYEEGLIGRLMKVSKEKKAKK